MKNQTNGIPPTSSYMDTNINSCGKSMYHVSVYLFIIVIFASHLISLALSLTSLDPVL